MLYYPVCNVVLPSMQCCITQYAMFAAFFPFISFCANFCDWMFSTLLILIRLCWMKCSSHLDQTVLDEVFFSSWSDCVGWSVLLILIRLCWMKCSSHLDQTVLDEVFFSSWSDCVGWSVHFHAHVLMKGLKCLMSRANILRGHSSYFMCIRTVGSIMILWLLQCMQIAQTSDCWSLTLSYNIHFYLRYTRTACCFGLLLFLFCFLIRLKLQKERKKM